MTTVPRQPGPPRQERGPAYTGPERRRDGWGPATGRLAALSRAAAGIVSARTVAEVAAVAVRAGVEAVGAGAGTLAVRDDQRRAVLLHSTDGYAADLVLGWPELPLDAPLPLAHVVRTGELLLLPDRQAALTRFPDAAGLQALTDEGGSRIVAAAVLPLRAHGRVLGALALTWPEERAFPSEDVELLDALSVLVAQALERVEHLAERDRALARERLLARSGELLRAGLEPAAVLDAAVALLRPELGDRVWVRLPDGTVHGDPPAVGGGTVEAALVADGSSLGTLGCARSGGPAHTPEDVALVRAVADRAALALAHALLFAEQRDTSLALQRALLTEPPDPPGLQVAVRYQPAMRAAVGGDWYDAFVADDGTTVLVIGDVVGHDTGAAASMGQLRGLLRAVAYVVDGGPATAVAVAEQAAVALSVSALATLVLAQVAPAGAAGDGRAVTWTSAGHLPPVVLGADGAVRVLASAPDLMLGVQVGSSRADHRHLLAAGDTLLLYTDGLVERRGSDLDAGVDELCARLAGLARLVPEQLCDAVLAAVLPHGADDDVALIAVRSRP